MSSRIELTESERSRFLSKFTPLDINEDVCWLWEGTTFANGYAAFWLQGQNRLASRVAYSLFLGEPGDMFVCHECDNPLCINPRHLFLGSPLMNMVDMQTKGRDTKRSGDTHPRAKLTAEKVVFAKQLRQMGFTNQAIGANFGVSESAIRQALSGRAWKQVFQEEAA